MTTTIKVGMQVTHRTKINTESTNIIRTGSVVSIHGQKATVHFPVDKIRREILISDLEPVSVRFPGRVRVSFNPTNRF